MVSDMYLSEGVKDMKKKLTVVLCLVLALLLLTGCASQTISKAKAAYESGDYQTVVDLLQDLKSSKPEVAELLKNAKIHLAFDAGDYQQVVDLIGDADVKDADIAALLKDAKTALEEAATAEAAKAAEEALLAEAQAAFDAGEFDKVVELLGDQDSENEALASLLKDAQTAIEEAASAEAQAALEAKVAEAQEAYDAGDYQTVVDLVKESGMESDELTGLADRAQTALDEASAAAEAAKAAEEALIAEAQAAFDNGDYEKVVEVLGEQAVENETVAALLKDAETAIEEAAKASEAEKAAAEEAAKAAEEAAAAEAAKAEEAAKAAEEAAAAEEARLAEEAAAIEAKLAEVQSAYDSGDYQAVVEMAENATVESEEIAALAVLAQTALDEEAAAAEAAAALEAKLAEVKTALDAEDYDQVIALVKEADMESDELTQLAAEAQTALDEIAAREAKVAEVKAAFDEEDYEKVVELVSSTDIESDELTQLAAEAQTALDEIAAKEAKLAEVKAAFDEEDYEKVVELVKETDIESDELTQLAADAQTALDEIAAKEAKLAEVKAAFDEEDYEKVVELVSSTDIESVELTELAAEAQTRLAEIAAHEAWLAEIRTAYEDEDYAKVVELVGDEVPEEAEVATMLADSRIQVAYQNGDYAEVVELMAEYDGRDSSEVYTNSIREVAKEAIFATGDDKYIQLPDDGSYLNTFKTRYIVHLDYDWWVFKIFKDVDDALEQQRACGPCVPVERYPRTDGGHTMPWAYEGTEVTVLAEQNDMSLILYLSSENKQRCGWVQNRFLVDSFPSRQVTIGEPKFTDVSTVRGIGMSWSKKGFLTTQQNYSVLSETVENCVGFTLDYQLIAENTDKWSSIFGPRSIYVNDGSDWIKVGTFDYPTQGTVKVTVNLEKPIDIVAIGTIAEVGLPNTFFFRQYATEYQVLG